MRRGWWRSAPTLPELGSSFESLSSRRGAKKSWSRQILRKPTLFVFSDLRSACIGGLDRALRALARAKSRRSRALCRSRRASICGAAPCTAACLAARQHAPVLRRRDDEAHAGHRRAGKPQQRVVYFVVAGVDVSVAGTRSSTCSASSTITTSPPAFVKPPTRGLLIIFLDQREVGRQRAERLRRTLGSPHRARPVGVAASPSPRRSRCRPRSCSRRARALLAFRHAESVARASQCSSIALHSCRLATAGRAGAAR